MENVEVFTNHNLAGMFLIQGEDVEKYALAVARSCGLEEFDINIVFVDDKRMTELNRQYRKREGTTDVLSFNLSDEGSTILEGEIYVSAPRAHKQATEHGVSPEKELIRLVTHGLLHLAGRTHDSEENYQSMAEETDTYVHQFFRDRM